MQCVNSKLFPLTVYQKDIWLKQEISGVTSEYNIGLIVNIHGELDKERLLLALRVLAKNHNALSLQLIKQEGKIYQMFSEDGKVIFLQDNWEENTSLERKQKIQSYFEKPFQMFNSPLASYLLVQIDENEFIFLMKYHHLILDGQSLYRLYDYLFKIYHDLEGNIPQLNSDYRGLIKASQLYEKSPSYQEDELFWKNYLSKGCEKLFGLSNLNEKKVHTKRIKLDENLYHKIKVFTSKYQISMYQFLLSALIIQYGKLADKEEMRIGVTIHNRKNKKMKETIGYCVNEIPFYIKLIPTLSLPEFMVQVKNNLFEVYRHASLPTGVILQGQSIDFSVNYQQNLYNQLEYKNKGWEATTVFNKSNDEDLVINIIETKDIELEIQYRKDLFENEQLTTELIDRLEFIINEILTKECIQEVGIALPEEIDKIKEWNHTVIPKDENITTYHLFNQIAKKYGDCVAIADCEKNITYKTLLKEVNSIANGLIEAGVLEGDRVALYLSKKATLVSSMLAIWQIGAGYIPLDKSYPNERIQFIIKNSQARFMIIDEDRPQVEAVNYLSLNQLKNNICFTETRTKPYQEAYIIYTSGTTGVPKGVMIHHKQLANAITYRRRVYDLTQKHTVLQVYSPCFDAFLAGTFTALISGSQLVLPNDREAKDPISIKNYIKRYVVTHIDMVPSFLKVVLQVFKSNELDKLQVIVVGGEKVSLDTINICHEKTPQAEIINEYGPTEATILATLERNMTPEIEDSIGKPIDNTQIYILNKQKNQMPIGLTGEIWIGGMGVSKGYIGREDLNQTLFVPDLFNSNQFMYKTGDSGKWTNEGIIAYKDRIDYQVKIRGYRIELREIEEQLKKVPGVTDSIVAALGENENKYLCGYYVATEKIEEKLVKDFLKQVLPNYMVPTYCMQLQKMPLSSNGKKDRKQLPPPSKAKKNYEEPMTQTECLLEKLILELLKMEKIGRNDNLFELGAHSLTIAIMTSKIYKVFQKEISLSFIFEHPTIKEIAKEINQNTNQKPKMIKQKKQTYYDLTPVQKRLFFIDKWKHNETLYNMPLLIKISSNIDEGRLEKAFNEVIAKNEALRTCFIEEEGECKQYVREKISFRLEKRIINESFIEAAKQLIRPFNLKKDELVRVTLLEKDSEKSLLIDLHHIIADGASTRILLEDLFRAYAEGTLPQKVFQFRDYVEWEKGLDLEGQKKYWLQMYDSVPAPLDMPLDFLRPKEQTFKGDSFKMDFPKRLTDKLYQFSRKTDLTFNMILISAYSILLSKYTGQEDIVIGIPSLGRNPEVEDMIGMFVQTLPLRMQPLGQIKVREYLKNNKDLIIKAYENQYYPLEELLNQLQLERDLSRNPLFDTMFVYQPKGELSDKNTFYEQHQEVLSKISKFDFTFNVKEEHEKLLVCVEFCTDLYQKSTMENLLKHYFYLIEQMVDAEEEKIQELEIILPEEKEEILKLNNNKKQYDEKNIINLFEEQVRKNPYQIAVIDQKQALTYEGLNQKANQLAHYLLEKGLQVEDRVAIKVARSTQTAIAILGIMKAGCAYVPIDITYPKERTNYIIENSGAKLLLDEDVLQKTTSYSNENPNIYIAPSNLAYVIYTSGTTGLPKGVMVEQRNIMNTLWHEKETNQLNKNHSTIILFSPAFDGFVIAFFSFITSGGQIILPDEDEGKNIFKIKNYIRTYKVTHMTIVPSLFSVLVEELEEIDLKNMVYIKLVGEKTSKKIITACKEKNPNLELINGYGPTETAVEATILRTMDEKNSHFIGTPISNTKVFIINKYHQMLPKGIKGEIAIAGKGVTRGYLANSELTEKKFIKCPFLKDEKMYLTGDLGKWSFNEQIEFLGRKDDQVKIRGFRIEIQEVERQLGKVKEIREVCITVEGNEHKYLCAYFTADVVLSENKIRETLETILPDYMMPSFFVQLEKMPVTPNGKIDKKKLPSPSKSIKNSKTKPRSVQESIIYEVWKEVLNVKDIGIEDSFFHIGGDSIKSMQVAAGLIKLGYEVEARTIMKYPTIKALAQRLIPIKSISRPEYVRGEIELTPIQRWFLYGQEKGFSHFNQSLILKMNRVINVQKMQETFEQVLKTHDVLRMKFYRDEKGEWKAYNQGLECKMQDFYVWYLDYAQIEKYVEEKAQEAQETLNIEEGRLIRVDIFKGTQGDYMSISIHHLVVDGVSLRIILEDIQEIYNDLLVGNTPHFVKTSSFQAWSRGLKQYKKSARITQYEKEYWTNISQKINTTKRRCVSISECEFVKMTLDKNYTNKLVNKINSFYESKTNEVLLAALSRAFYRWDHSQSIDITLEGHGRELIDDTINTTRTVGWFTSAYPVIIDYYSKMEEQIEQVKQHLRQIQNNGLNYGVLCYLEPVEANLECVTRIGFNYLGVMDSGHKQSLFELSHINVNNVIGKDWPGFHEIDLNSSVTNETLKIEIAYRRQLYTKEQLEELGQLFINEIKNIINYSEFKLQVLEMNHEIKGVIAFKELFYKDCFYHALFPALISYNLSLKPYLLNSLSTYGYDKNNGGLVAKNLEREKLDKLLNQEGLKTEKIHVENSVIDFICLSLQKEQAVIVPVDCYFLSYRVDTCKEKHWRHTLLIYGYNQEQSIFKVIDHEDVNSELFKEKIASFKDIEEAYKGYKKNFPEGEKEIYRLQKQDYSVSSREKLLQRHKEFLEDKGTQMRENLDNLLLFKTYLKELTKENTKESPIWQEILFNINEIIKSKLAEKYKLGYAIESMELETLVEKITQKWMLIKRKIQRYVMLGSNDFLSIQVCLEEIYKMEKAYLIELEGEVK